ncbi:hypothetical protein OESDEN_20121, partial [Oesophagostomum dentatum]
MGAAEVENHKISVYLRNWSKSEKLKCLRGQWNASEPENNQLTIGPREPRLRPLNNYGNKQLLLWARGAKMWLLGTTERLELVKIFAVLALKCIQCDKNAAWYSEEEHERHIELCQNGLVPATPCRNRTHTHCIVSWYRSGGSTDLHVLEKIKK